MYKTRSINLSFFSSHREGNDVKRVSNLSLKSDYQIKSITRLLYFLQTQQHHPQQRQLHVKDGH